MLKAEAVRKAFGATLALGGVDFEVRAGEVHALVGENGCGKSTLMRILHGEERADSGSLTLDGRPFSPRNPLEAARSGVALVHQELALCPHLTAAENIFLGEEKARGGVVQGAHMLKEAARVLESLGCSGDVAGARTSSLSASTRQMVEIARAVRSRAKVILFDEPTSSLGREEVERLFMVMTSLKRDGAALVYISHFLNEVQQVADRVTVMKDGSVVQTLAAAEAGPERLAALMTGRSADAEEARPACALGEVLLSASGLSGSRLPVDFQLSLRAGEVVGLAGLNASGRSETLRCLFGLARRRTGNVALLGSASGHSAGHSWRTGAGFVSEDRKAEGLALNMSLAENTTLPKPGGWRVSARAEEARTQKVMGLFGVKARSTGQRARELSGGNQQKIALGRLADAGARVLLLDEPTRGIDIGARRDIYSWIDRQAAEGRAMVIASSDLAELIRLCDRIIVLRRGAISAEFSRADATEQNLLEACAG